VQSLTTITGYKGRVSHFYTTFVTYVTIVTGLTWMEHYLPSSLM